jgi:hypothetical protein
VTCTLTAQSYCDEYATYGSYSLGGYCVPIYDELTPSQQSSWDTLENAFLATGAGSVALDIYKARWVMLISIFLAVIFSLLYIKTMDWCAFVLSWISVVLV